MEFSLENMCRTCMNEDGTMFSVFTVENRGISKICYADMLMACASLNVDRTDDLPQNICQHCLKHLSIAYSFKQQSERSEATLREITKNPDIEFIKEEIFEDTYINLNEDVPADNDSIGENDINLDDTGDDVSNEFKLTEEFLEDEFFADEEVDEIEQPKSLYSKLDTAKAEKYNVNKFKKEQILFDETNPLDTEFLEDEFILEYDSTNIQRTDSDNVALASEEFLEDNVLVQDEINPQMEMKFDLESLRKAVLKPKSSPMSNDFKLAHSNYRKNSLDLDLDCLRKSVFSPKPNVTEKDLERIKKSILTPKSKPGSRLLSRELKCPYCEQSFRTQQAFKKHKKQHGKKLKCELCLKEFRSTHGLRYHMKIHNGIKNYACNFGDCTKRFRLKQALDKHLSIHNNEKNHLCALCGKTYSTYDALHYHMKAHRGERPYLCIHCGKTFKQSCHLKSHMWVHSGIKPYRCSRCGKCYTSGHQLKKHVNKHCPPPANPTNPTDTVLSQIN